MHCRFWTLLLLLPACTIPSKTYVAKQRYSANRSMTMEEGRPAPSAPSELAAAKTVAFFPPDSCREEKAAGPGTTEVSSVLGLRCGVLLSELEAEATKARFNVVSWQALRGSERPITYAKQNGVDILFEINELSLDVPPQEVLSAGVVEFEDATGNELTVRQAKKVGRRCSERMKTGLPVAKGAVLDLKMVSVRDARVHWYYRRLKTTNDDARAITVTRSYVTPGVQGPLGCLANVGYLGWTCTAILCPMGALGGCLAGVGLLATRLPAMALAVALAAAAVGVAVASGVAGTALIVAGNLLGTMTATHPSPDNVLCNGPSVEEQSDRRIRRPTSEDEDDSGSSYETTSRDAIEASPEAKMQKKLLKQVVAQLMTDVLAVREEGLKNGIGPAQGSPLLPRAEPAPVETPAGPMAPYVPAAQPAAPPPPPAPAETRAQEAIQRVLINGVPAHGARSITIPDATVVVDGQGTLHISSPTMDAATLPKVQAGARVPAVFLNGRPMPAAPTSFSSVVVVDANGTFIVTRLSP